MVKKESVMRVKGINLYFLEYSLSFCGVPGN
jgi:hypothetical protein